MHFTYVVTCFVLYLPPAVPLEQMLEPTCRLGLDVTTGRRKGRKETEIKSDQKADSKHTRAADPSRETGESEAANRCY